MFSQFSKRVHSGLLTLLLLCISSVLMAQRSFSGKVSDSNGQPLAGATVQVDVRGKLLKARVVKAPFVRHGKVLVS